MAANAVRLQLHALAYNLGTFLRTLALPGGADRWSLTTLRERLVKIGAKVVSHGRYVTFQMAEVAVPRRLFAGFCQVSRQMVVGQQFSSHAAQVHPNFIARPSSVSDLRR